MSRTSVGFWLFRTKGKDGSYHPRWRFRYLGADGKPAVATGFSDKGETRRLAQQLTLEADEIRRGVRKPPQPADTESLKPISVPIEAYLAWGSSQGGRGGRPWAKGYRKLQASHLSWWVEALGLKTLRGITLSGVEKALQAKAAGDAVTGKTLSNMAMTLYGFAHWCVKRKYLASDPLDGLRKFDCSVSSKNFRRAFTLEEVGSLLATSPSHRRLVYRLALVTGFRASEIKSLRVGDLDVESRTLLLKAENAKNRKEAPCALPVDLAEELGRYSEGRAPEQALLPDFNPNHAVRLLDLDLEAAGIAKRTFDGKVDFHALRTTHVNLGIELGFDVKTAQTLARHESPQLTMNVYARANTERLRAAVNMLGEAIGGAEAKRNSQKVVKREELPLAEGAENLTQLTGAQGDDTKGEMVGATGFEPATSWSRTRRSSQAEPRPDAELIWLNCRLPIRE